MGIIWCDPGAKFTGVAKLCDDGSFNARQFADPVKVYDWINIHVRNGDTFGVEDYTHGGIFTKEAKQTLMVVGFLKYNWEYDYRKPAKVVNKDRRLPWVEEATQMVKYRYPDLSWPETKDAVSALAHCLAERHYASE
jgi:hypothetical protein